jgi:hypothetical protein
VIGATVGKSAGPTDNCWELLDPGQVQRHGGPIGLAGHRLGVLLTSVVGGDPVQRLGHRHLAGVHC